MQVKAYDKRFKQYCSLESRLLAEISSETAQRKCSISKDCTSTNSEVPVVLYQAIAGVNYSRWSPLFKHANFAGEFSRTITACSQANKCNPGLILKVSCKLLGHSICIFYWYSFCTFCRTFWAQPMSKRQKLQLPACVPQPRRWVRLQRGLVTNPHPIQRWPGFREIREKLVARSLEKTQRSKSRQIAG